MADKATRAVVIGLAGGALATATMSVALVALDRARSRREQARTDLPFKEATRSVAERAGATPRTSAGRTAQAWVSHFAFGCAMGAVYAGASPRMPNAWLAAAPGILFGLALWAASYVGTLPALRLLPPAEARPTGHNVMNIGGHIVFGATLGASVEALRRAG
jgi:uncharacterized membrane protein YagU involved in acid resistance